MAAYRDKYVFVSSPENAYHNLFPAIKASLIRLIFTSVISITGYANFRNYWKPIKLTRELSKNCVFKVSCTDTSVWIGQLVSCYLSASLGVPDDSGLRPLCWKILLNYLPAQRNQWNDVLSSKRELYKQFISKSPRKILSDQLVVPSNYFRWNGTGPQWQEARLRAHWHNNGGPSSQYEPWQQVANILQG